MIGYNLVDAKSTINLVGFAPFSIEDSTPPRGGQALEDYTPPQGEQRCLYV